MRLFARVLLRFCIPAHLREAIAGDLEEQWNASGRRGYRYCSGALRSIVDCWRGRLRYAREESRQHPRGDGVIRSIGQDTRFAGRMMLRSRGFALAAVLTLALGIGGSTAIFSTVKPALFEPLPYPDAGRVVFVCDRGQDGACADVTFGTFREVLARNRTVESLAVARPWQPVLSGVGDPERLEGQRVSAAYFRVLAIHPVQGRTFEDGDDRPRAPRVVILTDGLWRRRFSADPAILGRTVTLGDAPFTVVGILPRGFEHVMAPRAELFTALQYDPALPVDGREWGHHLRMIGRLQPGVSLEAAATDFETIARGPLPEWPRVPWASLQGGFIVTGLQEALTRDVKPALLAFSAAVGLVLLIASANVANLLLARALHRKREFAVRAALGAGRGRLVRQLLTEALLISASGGALGVVAAYVGVDALLALGPPGLPRLDAIAVDRAALLFALGVTIVVGVGIAVVPAVHAFREDPQRSLQHDSRTSVGGHRAARQALVVVEVALALVLLVSAGLLFRSLREVVSIAPGFNAQHVLAAQVQVAGQQFRDAAATYRFFEQVVDRVRAIPGVSTVAQTSMLPLGGDPQRFGVFTEHTAPLNPNDDTSAFRYSVSPGYFDAMGIPLRRGRFLEDRDDARASRVAVISERLAARRFRGMDPLGQRMRVGGSDTPWFTVVGIVADVKQTSLDVDDAEAVYVTPSQWHFADPAMWLVVRSTAGEGLPSAIRSAVWSVDKNQPIVRMTPMTSLVRATTAERRFALLVFGVFGGVALVLAVTGLYGALARSVTERTREIGVRAALGASRPEILGLVLKQGLGLAFAGVVAGIAGSIVVTRLLETLLFGTAPTDPFTYAGAALLFMTVAAVASSVPALRAATIDPAIALRAE